MFSLRTVALVCALAITAPLYAPRLVRAQSAGAGTLTGFVGDARSGDLIRQAGVEIVGADKTLLTGVDGDYSVDLPAGTYRVRFFFEGYVERIEENVTVTAGATTQVDAVLVPVGYGESVDVIAGPGGDIVGALEDRRAATTISDNISKAEIAADTSSTAAGVLERVTGVTVQNDFVFVRGLGERYSNTVINDALVPTPQPDRRVVPMDLIPTALIQDVKILKTFTPDQPGEFSGGLVRLDTVELPQGASMIFSYSIGFNDQTQGEPFLSYPGGHLDFFGFGLDRRNLPDVIPTDQRVVRGNIFVPGGFTPLQLQDFGRAFDDVWSPGRYGARPENTFNLSGGNTFGRLGVVAAIGIKNEPHSQKERRVFYGATGGEDSRLVPLNDYDFDVSEETARLGLTANLAYKLSDNNKIFWKNLFTNQATDEARTYEGFNEDRGKVLRDSRLRYVQERIETSQFSGNHLLPSVGNLIVNWRYTLSRATLDEPDLRESLYEQDPLTGEFDYVDQNQSLFRLFNAMRENIREPAVDVSRFWFRDAFTLNVKVGAAYSNRDRTFDSRRFRFAPRGVGDIDLSAPPEELLSYDNIDPNRGFELREETRNTDHYDARQDTTAGYAMGDVTFGKWRFIGGARVERSTQQVKTFEPFKLDTVPGVFADLDDTDWLPSVGGVYALTPTMNVRAGFSRTVSRPQFRELSPFEFTDVVGGRSSVGNPDLRRTLITNWDLRYEWYLSPNELISASYFYKDLNDPIEQIVEPGANVRTSFRNADKAINQGLELEVRKSLGAMWGRLQNASFNVNYTFVDSNVTLGDLERSVVTSLERPLVGQSKNVFNANLLYDVPKWAFDARAFFNYQGERITDVGALGLPDIVEKGFPSLDLRFSKRFGAGDRKRWGVEVELENLLNRQHDERQGDLPFRTYRSGRDYSVGVTYNIF